MKLPRDVRLCLAQWVLLNTGCENGVSQAVHIIKSDEEINWLRQRVSDTANRRSAAENKRLHACVDYLFET